MKQLPKHYRQARNRLKIIVNHNLAKGFTVEHSLRNGVYRTKIEIVDEDDVVTQCEVYSTNSVKDVVYPYIKHVDNLSDVLCEYIEHKDMLHDVAVDTIKQLFPEKDYVDLSDKLFDLKEEELSGLSIQTLEIVDGDVLWVVSYVDCGKAIYPLESVCIELMEKPNTENVITEEHVKNFKVPNMDTLLSAVENRTYEACDRLFKERYENMMLIKQPGEFKVRVVKDANGFYHRSFVLNPGTDKEECVGLYPTANIIGCVYPFVKLGPDLRPLLRTYELYASHCHADALAVMKKHFSDVIYTGSIFDYKEILRECSTFDTTIYVARAHDGNGSHILSVVQHNKQCYPLHTVFIENDVK